MVTIEYLGVQRWRKGDRKTELAPEQIAADKAKI